MYGVESSLPSRTIALCPAYVLMVVWSVVFSWPAWPALTRPRLYSASVIRLNSCEPWRVNCSVTIGWPVFGSTSAVMPDSTRSFPVSSGGPFGLRTAPLFVTLLGVYLNRYQYLPLFELPFEPAPGHPVETLQKTGSRCAGTFSTTRVRRLLPALVGQQQLVEVRSAERNLPLQE